ncbi:MAG: carbon-nitrogen hydrolase family protein [Gammaproteobacteria bacterium]|nr:MAG: carbon-nitrogen hydrolase family protein [Gammaproteobacteria bacterium]
MERVAAIQINARLGDVAYNLDHVRELAEDAANQGAKVIAVPEFFTTPIVLDDCVYQCALPPENQALDLLKEIATNYEVIIGGSYLEKRNGEVFNCYALVRPDGTVTRHYKDIPTMIENAFYIGGNTAGIHQTDMGRIGTALCWEQIRTQTVRRLKDKVDFLMTGTHWWTIPKNWSIFKSTFAKMDVENLEIFRSTPGVLAKLLGTVNIHASHCGSVAGKYPILPWGRWDVPYETDLLGETQIIDNTGQILARRTREDGPGVIIADVDLTAQKPTLELPDRFWIPELPSTIKLMWHHQNILSKPLYKRAKKERKI